MARVTVEDCIERISNRFELVLLATQRARDIHSGSCLMVERDNDKNPVVALREIAEGKLEFGILTNSIVRGLQKTVDVEEPEVEDMPVDLSLGDMMIDEPVEDMGFSVDQW